MLGRQETIDTLEYVQNMDAAEIKNVQDKRVTVIGAARSGVAAAKLLLHNGAKVFVSDSGAAEKLVDRAAELRASGIEFEVSAHSGRVFDADFIVISPGIPSTAAVVQDARKRELRIISEIELASWFCPCPIIAVTGTNGKTTTTTLIGRLLADAKKRHAVAGNIGKAFSSVIDELDNSSLAVLEVSSFQLDDIESFHPMISVILNITPDHLDRYEHSFKKYIASKCRIFEHQTTSDFLIYNYDDEETREHVRRLASLHVHTLPFSIHEHVNEGAFIEKGKLITILSGRRSEIIATEEMSIKGIHNQYNAMAALLAAQISGVSIPSIRATLRNFKGVEHRLEFVRELEGVKFVNDSKATNVDSVWYALQAYNEPIVLLLGGRDKGNEYEKLFDLVKKNVKAIVAIGESAGKVCAEFSWFPILRQASSMEEAVKTSASIASTGDVVLLSPACASFDWFENYEHRGRVFKQLVNSL